MDLDEQAWLAEAILQNRRDRKASLPPAIFSEFAWDALLLLFVADARSDRLTGEELAVRIGCATTVLGRWIKYLSDQGLIVGDGSGETEVLLTLSPAGLSAIEEYLAETQKLAGKLYNARTIERRRDDAR